jgi:hypothetical protein
MTDIVERLRSKEINTGLCGEAADEIERLHALCDNLSRIAISKEAEIERLTATLATRLDRPDTVRLDHRKRTKQ